MCNSLLTRHTSMPYSSSLQSPINMVLSWVLSAFVILSPTSGSSKSLRVHLWPNISLIIAQEVVLPLISCLVSGSLRSIFLAKYHTTDSDFKNSNIPKAFRSHLNNKHHFDSFTTLSQFDSLSV